MGVVDLGDLRNVTTPLGRDSKISEEDPQFWIGDSKIRIDSSKKNLKTWERKTQIFISSILSTNMSHKGLYTMGLNTKSPT